MIPYHERTSDSLSVNQGLKVLLAGPSGSGVSLAYDLLLEAAAMAGFAVREREHYHQSPRGDRLVMCLIAMAEDRGPLSALHPEVQVDFILPFHVSCEDRFCSQLSKAGKQMASPSLWQNPSEEFLGSSSLKSAFSGWFSLFFRKETSLATVATHPRLAQKPQPYEHAGLMLGQLSTHLSIEADDWRVAFGEHLPPSQISAAWQAFQAGIKQQTGVLPRSFRESPTSLLSQNFPS
ncbi:Hypothetical protein PBC10988_31240 [Planctomycetales bacterium 10988]|nr:Hypothetical protein PBC10988_31240 [Planctomycetales bacterium 10988]